MVKDAPTRRPPRALERSERTARGAAQTKEGLPRALVPPLYFIFCMRTSLDNTSRLILARLCVPSFAFSSFRQRFSLPTCRCASKQRAAGSQQGCTESRSAAGYVTRAHACV